MDDTTLPRANMSVVLGVDTKSTHTNGAKCNVLFNETLISLYSWPFQLHLGQRWLQGKHSLYILLFWDSYSLPKKTTEFSFLNVPKTLTGCNKKHARDRHLSELIMAGQPTPPPSQPCPPQKWWFKSHELIPPKKKQKTLVSGPDSRCAWCANGPSARSPRRTIRRFEIVVCLAYVFQAGEGGKVWGLDGPRIG